MTNFVFVHGAFHGAWCWKPLLDELKAQGHQTTAIDLPGSGEDQTPIDEVTLEAAVARVIETIRLTKGPAVLVGHSMGGVVITQVADRIPELLDRVVYIAGFRPRNGEALLDLAALPEGAGDGVQANLTVAGNPPMAIFNQNAAAEIFYHDCPPVLVEWATPRLKPQPTALDITPVVLQNGAFPTSDYIVCTDDRATPVSLQKFMATRDFARVFELSTGHSPFMSRPTEVAKILTTTT